MTAEHSPGAQAIADPGSKKRALRSQNTPTRPSLRNAVDAMCKACLYDARGAGTWRAQVAACTAHSCPLHPVRPQQKVAP